MDSTLLLNRPVAKPRIEPKITKINNLVESADQIKKTSTKLRKVFEKGSYQKKTQLSVLKRYKKRLEIIQKQNDRSFRKKQKVKLKLPDIKKYVGNFFTPGSADDPLKAIAALAAFKAVQKGTKGDWGGALASGLVAAGLTLGPTLLGLGAGALMNRGNRGGGVGGVGPGAVSTPSKPLKPGSVSRLNASQARFIQGNANIGDRARLIRRGFISPTGAFSRGGTEQMAKYGADTSKVGKAFGRFGKAIIPGVGAAVGAIDAGLRTSQGDYTGATIAGTSATLDALAAASAATGIGLPVAGLLSIASFALDVTNLVRDLSGASEKEAAKNKPQQDKLKKQTEEQKKLVEKKKESKGGLTFRKTLDRYEKCIDKFEEFVKGFKDGMGMGGEQSGSIETGNRAIETGENLQDLEATGGEVPGAPDSRFGPRGGRLHKGNDYNRSVGTPISIIQPGTVTVADMNYDPSGWGAVVEIRHQDGSISRYAHLSQINVAAGTQVSPGQVIGKVGGAPGAPGSGNSTGAHLHFEYENGSGRIDPTAIAPRIFRFGGNVRVRQQSSQSQPSNSRPSTAAQLRAIGQSGAASVLERQQPPTPRRPPSIAPSLRAPRSVGSFLPYETGSQQQVTAFYPVSQPQQQPMPSEDIPMMMTGPSEQQLLNSFYKRVLLNTV